MLVRKFENRDAGRVARIMFESFRSFLGERMRNGKPEPEEYWISCSRGETGHSMTRAFVAEENGTVIGYICVSANTKSGLGVLHMIGVDPAVFAKGCGRALFEAAETFWREQHMRKIHTCISTPARRRSTGRWALWRKAACATIFSKAWMRSSLRNFTNDRKLLSCP